MSTLTLDLHPDQLKAILKQTLVSDPAIVKEVLEEIKNEATADDKFDRVVDDIFNRYDDVFKALA